MDMSKLGGGWGLYEPPTDTASVKVLPYLILSAVVFLALFAVFA
mgnify:CR=1 FL=1|jgi:hypothetical protein